jgi:hypothetical protein
MNRIHIMALICLIGAPMYVFSAVAPSADRPIALTTIAHSIDWAQLAALEKKADYLVDHAAAKFAHQSTQLLVKTACCAALAIELYSANKCIDHILKYNYPKNEILKNRDWWRAIRWGALSTLCFGSALYLYLYKWDMPFIPPIVPTGIMPL